VLCLCAAISRRSPNPRCSAIKLTIFCILCVITGCKRQPICGLSDNEKSNASQKVLFLILQTLTTRNGFSKLAHTIRGKGKPQELITLHLISGLIEKACQCMGISFPSSATRDCCTFCSESRELLSLDKFNYAAHRKSVRAPPLVCLSAYSIKITPCRCMYVKSQCSHSQQSHISNGLKEPGARGFIS
jgi:hypothetical protein